MSEHCAGCGGWVSTYSGQAEGYECNGLAAAREGPGLEVYDSVLRGLRSEEDTPQMRAVIASVEAQRAAAGEEDRT